VPGTNVGANDNFAVPHVTPEAQHVAIQADGRIASRGRRNRQRQHRQPGERANNVR
jgi:hypothetical protein